MSLNYQHTRFRYAHQAVGVFVILTMIIFVAAFLFSGQVQEWLNPGQEIKVILPSDGLFGLAEGADVEILGTKAGRVVRIVINPNQQMHADVLIESEMIPFVRRDSTAIIRKRFGVAGASFLHISRGFGTNLDWEYAVITATADRAPTVSIGVILDEMRAKIFPVIDDTQKAIQTFLSVVDRVEDPEGDFQQLLLHFRTITGKVARGEGAIGRLVTDDEIVSDMEGLIAALSDHITHLGPILKELQVTTRNISNLSANINAQAKQMPKVTQNFQEILNSLRAVMADLRRTSPQLPKITRNVDDAVSSLPVLLLQTQQVMLELEQLIKQIQSSWLLGGKKDARPQPATRISPYEVRP